MIRRLLLVAGLAVVALTPARAIAQRGVGGLGRGRLGLPARDPGVSIPKQVNMINLLIERRQEVALSDSQFVRVIALKRVLDSTNAPMLRKLDSVERLFRGGGPIFSEPSSPARRDSLAQARNVVREAAVAVHDNNQTFRDRAYELLNIQQLAKAQEIEAKAEKLILDAEKRKP